jgi:hypothetical protein
MVRYLLTAGALLGFIACGQTGGHTQEKTNTDSSTATGNTAIHTSIKDSIPPDADLVADLCDTSDWQEPNLWAAVNSFIPEGYSMLNCTAGDLNLDSLEDRVLVLKKNGEDSTSDVVDHPEKRPLLLLIREPGKTFKLAARSNNAVLCVDCGGMMGDPFQGITIKKGYFSVEHYGGSAWRWSRVITFKYSKEENNWLLHKDGHLSYHNSDPDKTEEKIYTTKDFGKVQFADFDVYKDQ